MVVDCFGRPLVSQKREVQTSDPRIATFAACADDVFKHLELTVVCVRCGGTPMGANAPTDARWTLECACTVRRLTNPTVRSH